MATIPNKIVPTNDKYEPKKDRHPLIRLPSDTLDGCSEEKEARGQETRRRGASGRSPYHQHAGDDTTDHHHRQYRCGEQ